MASLLDHTAVVEYGNKIAEFAGGQPVTDVNGCTVAGDLVKPAVDFRSATGSRAAWAHPES